MTWTISLCLTIVASVSAAPADSLRVRAVADIEGGRPERAVAALKRVIGTGEETARDYVLMGRAYLVAGNQKEARNAFRKAVKRRQGSW